MSNLTEEEERMLNEALEEAHKEIPENSNSILVSQTTSRFSSAIWYDKIKEQDIILAGVGGIGSYIAFLLARMLPKSLYIYDDDVVEEGNMSGQLYCTSDIGKSKVNAITETLKNYSSFYNLFAINSKFTSERNPCPIMICGFDNMSARNVFYHCWRSYVDSLPEEEKAICLLIDGRLAAEEFQIFAIQGNDIRAMKEYENNWLFSDLQADTTICSYKQTSFCANMIASYMVNIFVNFIANQCEPLIERDVPFYTTYNAETMFFKTKA